MKKGSGVVCQYPLSLVVSMLSPQTLAIAVEIGHFGVAPLNHYKCKTNTNIISFSSKSTIPNIPFSPITQQLTQKLGQICMSKTLGNCSSKYELRQSPRHLEFSHSEQL